MIIQFGTRYNLGRQDGGQRKTSRSTDTRVPGGIRDYESCGVGVPGVAPLLLSKIIDCANQWRRLPKRFIAQLLNSYLGGDQSMGREVYIP
jgi:hypothetical protein